MPEDLFVGSPNNSLILITYPSEARKTAIRSATDPGSCDESCDSTLWSGPGTPAPAAIACMVGVMVSRTLFDKWLLVKPLKPVRRILLPGKPFNSNVLPAILPAFSLKLGRLLPLLQHQPSHVFSDCCALQPRILGCLSNHAAL